MRCILYFLESLEAVSLLLYRAFGLLIIDLKNVSIHLKPKAKVMGNGGEPFIGQFDGAIGHCVNLAFLKHLMPFGGGVVEHSGLNLSIFSIHEIHIKQAPLTSGVGPSFDWIFFDHLDFDDPVLHECIHTFDWHVLFVRLVGFARQLREMINYFWAILEWLSLDSSPRQVL